MKNQKKMAKHPWIEASDEMVKWATGSQHKYITSADILDFEQEKILLLHFYPVAKLSNGIVNAEFRVFQTQEDYITEALVDGKQVFTTGSINHKLGWYFWNNVADAKVLFDEHIKAIEEFTQSSNEGQPLKLVCDLQTNIQKSRLDKKHKAITDVIDERMEHVLELPEDFKDWINNTAMHFSRYIFYTYDSKSKVMDGTCTHCLKEVKVTKPKHNHIGTCPSCSSQVQFKASGKTTRHFDQASAAVFQNYNEGFIVRFFRIRRFFDHCHCPSTHYDEVRRDFHKSELIPSTIKPYFKESNMAFEFGLFKQTGKTRWCNYEGHEPMNEVAVYSDNLDGILENTRYKYSALKTLVESKPGFQVNLGYFFERFSQQPYIEYLIKLGLFNLTSNLLSYEGVDGINKTGNSLESILKIDKLSLKTLQNLNGNRITLSILQAMEKAQLRLTDHLIKEITLKIGNQPILFKLAQYTTIHKVVKYLNSQKKSIVRKKEISGCWMSSQYKATVEPEDHELSNAFKDYMDYITFCTDLKYDLMNEFILFPRDLKHAHDEASKNVQIYKDKISAEKRRLKEIEFNAMASKLNELYGLRHKNFIVMAPESAAELTNEGQTLHHCVSTYLDRIVAGRSIVLFIRKVDEPKTPYCTIEIIDNHINQCRGKNNKNMSEEVAGVLKKLRATKLQVKEAVNQVAM